jgi:hypothetical protein
MIVMQFLKNEVKPRNLEIQTEEVPSKLHGQAAQEASPKLVFYSRKV